jgi:hypothetical protein
MSVTPAAWQPSRQPQAWLTYNVGQRKIMADYIKSALELLKLAPRYLIAIGIAAAFLLFGSDQFLTRLGLKKFTEDYRVWLGLAFVSTVSLFVIYVAGEVVAFFRRKIGKRMFMKRVIERLNRMTEDEKQILRYYFAKNTRSNVLRMDDGVVQGLVADGIIFRSANLGSMVEGFAHNISDVVWDYIHSNPDLLRGSTNTYRTDKMPSWRETFEG